MCILRNLTNIMIHILEQLKNNGKSSTSMLLVILKEKKLLERFTKKMAKKTNQKEFKVEKVIERKGVKLYVKWKGYDSSFNSCIDKKGKWVNIFHKRN